MFDAAAGLSEVSTDELKKALSMLHRGELSFPPAALDWARVGLQHVSAPLLGMTRGLDEAGVRAVLVAVIAERLPANQRRLAMRLARDVAKV